jgi:CRISPR/Cas system CSM-associated protein Csm5 (group 7 of RAMP superfamily)
MCSYIYIYMYREGEYIKNLLKKYNNRKINTYLILPSNSWWINNTGFGEVKLMMSASLRLHKEISQLKL